MNSFSARMRAIAVTLLAFGFGAALLGIIVIGFDHVAWLGALLPASLPAPGNWIGPAASVTAMRLLVSVFLVIGAMVLALRSVYLDRMFEIFGDVLLMIMAALAGLVAGSWGVLRALGGTRELPLWELLPLGGLFAVVFITIALMPRRARSALPLRLLAIGGLLVAAPLLLSAPIFA